MAGKDDHNSLCIVLGGCRGLGKSIALRFLKANWDVVVVGRSSASRNDSQRIDSPVASGRGKLTFLMADLDQRESVSFVFNDLCSQKLKPRVIVHNYGGTVSTRLVSEGLDGWFQCLWKNVFFAAELNARVLADVEISSDLSRIVHVSSASARHLMGSQVYATSKALLNAYVRTNGRIVSRRGVIQLAIAPGALNTENGPWSRKSKDVLNDFLSHYQFSGELGSENTISELVFSLCGPAGDFCHGNIIECDGGSI
jgi:3-oxoacyl-[acyl-carrier protein] reductase